jgi:hypothetical protein
MGSVKRAVRVGVLAGALLMSSMGTARANEIWVAPTIQQDLGGVGIASSGIWPVTPLGAVRLAWGVPGNLQTFTGARLVLIPHTPGGAATLTLYVCAAKSGDMATPAGCTGPFNHAFTGVANQLLEVDVSAAIAPQVGLAGTNHLSVLAFTAPTTATDHIVGLRFAYDPVVPPGVATLGANTFTGAQTAPAFVGDGSGLTNVPLPAGSATLGANTFSGPQTAPAFIGNGSGLTNLPFPAGVATLGANTFAGTQTLTGGNFDLGPSSATAGQLTRNGVSLLHSFGTNNTFLGAASGNFTLTGTANTAVGGNAFAANTSGSFNTAVGFRSLNLNTTGTFNTAVGLDALRRNTTALGNTALGYQALMFNDTGEGNTATGADALESNVSGEANTGTGTGALRSNTTGNSNTASGASALQQNTIGHANVALGRHAGLNATTGSNNIYLGSFVTGVAGESDTMYLGRVGTQTRAFIAGVRGIAPANADALPVVIDSTGQLGTVSPTGIATLSANTFAGNQAFDAGNLDLDPATATTGAITKNGTRFLHDFGAAGNTFLGSGAGNFTTTSNDNTGLGAGALVSVTTGSNNTAVGVNALAANATGAGNTAVGEVAMFSNTIGSANTAVGGNSLQENIDGVRDAAFGHSALRFNTSGFSNTATGVSALHFNTTGNRNTAVGDDALRNNTTGSRNVAIGWGAGLSATTGSFNIFLGENTIGMVGESNAMYLGRMGFQTKTVIAGVRGTAVSGGEMVLVDAAGRFGSSPIPPATNLQCDGCVGRGDISFSDGTGSGNTFVGITAGNTTTSGQDNTALGEGALTQNTVGIRNTAVGRRALAGNAAGNFNTAFGQGSLESNVTGRSNTAIGDRALFGNVAGENNAAVGGGALENNTGSANVALGTNAGLNSTFGSNNIYLGSFVQGAAGESNTMYLGRLGTQTRTMIAGVRGITTGIANAVNVVIDSAGQLGTISSSRRFKEDIRDMDAASERLLRLRPVTFRYTQPFAGGEKPIQYGLIAEEVAEVFPDLAVRGADGQIETVQYQKLDAMLLNELQKLHREVQALKAEIARLRQPRDERK